MNSAVFQRILVCQNPLKPQASPRKNLPAAAHPRSPPSEMRSARRCVQRPAWSAAACISTVKTSLRPTPPRQSPMCSQTTCHEASRQTRPIITLLQTCCWAATFTCRSSHHAALRRRPSPKACWTPSGKKTGWASPENRANTRRQICLQRSSSFQTQKPSHASKTQTRLCLKRSAAGRSRLKNGCGARILPQRAARSRAFIRLHRRPDRDIMKKSRSSWRARLKQPTGSSV